MNNFKKIILSEEGAETTENILWNVIWALGGAAVAFGLLSVARSQGSKAKTDLGAIKTPNTLPSTSSEGTSTVTSGSTGAVTGISN